MRNLPAAITNPSSNSFTYDRTREIGGKMQGRDRILAEIAGLEREQIHAESMMIAAIIYSGDLAVAKAATTEAAQSTGLRIPVHMNPRNATVLDAVFHLMEAGDQLSAENITDALDPDAFLVDEPPLDIVARVCSIAPDTADRTPFPYARRIDEAAARRLQLGQRVWPEALYRWFDWDGQLLYVGITRDLATRQDSHSRNSSWGRFAVRCIVERFPTRDAVEVMERCTIEKEKPLFNSTFNDAEAPQRLVAYLVEQGHLDLLAPAVSRG